MASKKKTNDVPALKPTADVPAFLKNSGRGMENVDNNDVLLPRIILLQAMSPEVTGKDAKGKPGDIINNVTGRNYGRALKFVPIIHFKRRIHWGKDREDPMVCQSMNGLAPLDTTIMEQGHCIECPASKWDNTAKSDKEKSPKCTLYYCFVVIVEGDTTPVIMSMEKTKVAAAKKLMSIIRFSGANQDMFAQEYLLESVEDSTDKYNYFNYKIGKVGYVKEDVYKACEGLYESLKNQLIDMHGIDKPQE